MRAAIDDELNFTKHINNICTKGARKVGVLMRFRNLIPTEAKIENFQSFYSTPGYILSYSMAPYLLKLNGEFSKLLFYPR